MNEVLQALLQGSRTMTPMYLRDVMRLDGTEDVPLADASTGISAPEVDLVMDVVATLQPQRSLEVGFGYGVSTLAICDAAPPTCAHIVIDPHQSKHWQQVGLRNIERAGFSNRIELHEDFSYRVLPKLEARGTRLDFAFIDGWHTFDFGLVDFFFIDRMLGEGGVVGFDDADWPAIRRVLRFIVTNLDYEVYRTLPSQAIVRSRRRRVYETWIAALVRLSRIAARMPTVKAGLTRALSAEALGIDRTYGLEGSCLFLRKRGDDRRPVTHYVPF